MHAATSVEADPKTNHNTTKHSFSQSKRKEEERFDILVLIDWILADLSFREIAIRKQFADRNGGWISLHLWATCKCCIFNTEHQSIITLWTSIHNHTADQSASLGHLQVLHF